MADFEAWLVFLILVVNVVGELQRKRTLAASRGFLAAARLSCFISFQLSFYAVFLSFQFQFYLHVTICTIQRHSMPYFCNPHCYCNTFMLILYFSI